MSPKTSPAKPSLNCRCRLLRPDGTTRATFRASSAEDAQHRARRILKKGALPKGWKIEATGGLLTPPEPLPTDLCPHCSHAWNTHKADGEGAPVCMMAPAPRPFKVGDMVEAKGYHTPIPYKGRFLGYDPSDRVGMIEDPGNSPWYVLKDSIRLVEPAPEPKPEEDDIPARFDAFLARMEEIFPEAGDRTELLECAARVKADRQAMQISRDAYAEERDEARRQFDMADRALTDRNQELQRLKAIPPMPEEPIAASMHRAALKRMEETGETYQVALLTLERDSARNGRESWHQAQVESVEETGVLHAKLDDLRAIIRTGIILRDTPEPEPGKDPSLADAMLMVLDR